MKKLVLLFVLLPAAALAQAPASNPLPKPELRGSGRRCPPR
jgi:hypothetical protein